MIFDPLTQAATAQLVTLWNQHWPGRYRLDSQAIQQQILESPLLMEECSFWAPGSGFAAVKRSPIPGLYPGQATGAFHLSAFAADLDAADRLLAEVIGRCRSLGASALVFAADHDHLAPGCPLDYPELEKVLLAAGFDAAEGLATDVERDLAGYEPPEGCLAPLEEHGYEVRPGTPDDLEEVDLFFQDAFPGRWRHDTLRKMRDDQEPHQVDLLMRGSKCFGFSLTQDETTRHPVGGGIWRLDLGEGWASLGPIGISSQVRGLGLGGALLGASLQRLAGAGRRRTIIDWTTLLDFYGMHGFLPARQYRSLRLAIV